MKKDIALASLFLSPNYGAILQSLALQQYIEILGFTTHYLPYNIPTHFSPLRYLLNRGNYILSMMLGGKRRNKRTEDFRRKYIHVAQSESSYEQYVAGSDQIWRPQLIKDTHGFFLFANVDAKRISYGSSFGVTSLPEGCKDFYKKTLSKFSYISVREKSGESILRNLGISKFDRVCDPTFLLSQNDWRQYTAPRQYKKPYILCYVMKGDIPTANYIYRVALGYNREQGDKYDIIIIGDREYRKLKFGYHLICDAGPSEFLSYIYYAEAVITSSFHGTCFSLIFNKPFRNVLDRMNQFNTRIINLLEEFGISDKVLYTDQQISNTEISMCIPNNSKTIIQELQQHGRNYLRKSLSH